MTKIISKEEKEALFKHIDENYSSRHIALDPKGYFLIQVNQEQNELIVEQFSNNIDEKGIAKDPKTGKPLKCTNGAKRTPIKIFKGKTAKEVGIQLTEGNAPFPISKLDHALYLGRELQKAEDCLINGKPYIQD